MYATFLIVTSILAPGPVQGTAPTDEGSSPTVRPEVVEPETTGSTWRPPFVLEVEGPEAPRGGETIRLRIQIERHLVEDTPMSISVALPAGAELLEGQLDERLVDASSSSIVRELTLRLGAELPEENVVVTVEQKGDGWGAHAAKTYEFGRQKVRALGTELRRGPPVDLGGGIIVRPVQVD